MTRRDQLLLVVILSIVAIAAYYLLLLSPKVKQASDLATQLGAAQTRRLHAHASLATALRDEAAYPANVRALRRLAPAVPRVDSTSKLLRQVDAAARRAGVNFAAITLSAASSSAPAPSAVPPAGAAPGATPAPTQPKANLPPIPPGYSATSPTPTVVYSATFKGGYLQLQRFIGAMQHFVAAHRDVIRVRGRLIDVSSIQVTSTGVVVTMTAYLLPASDQAPIPVLRPTTTADVPSKPAASKATAATSSKRSAG